MKQDKFLEVLQKRAQENQQLREGMLFPDLFRIMLLWLGKHPWRIGIPLSFLFTLLLYKIFGHTYIEAVLFLFGKL